MGTVLGMIALFQRAGMREFEEHFGDPRVSAFREKVTMALDPEVDRAYPERWIGKVTVETSGGPVFHGQIAEPRGDPGNSLSRVELQEKALRLADYSGAATHEEMGAVFARIRDLTKTDEIGTFLE
jgi:2-methylcitrate dehydratase PrpD